MSSSGRSSLLVALGHRAVARKCEQLASRPSAFKSTAQHACTRKSCLKREGSPEPSIILSSVDSTGKQTLEGGPSSSSAPAVAARRMSSSDTSGYEGSENGDSPGSPKEEAERERARRASEAQEQEPLPLPKGCKGGHGEEGQEGQGQGCSHLWGHGRRRAEGEDSGEETEGAVAYDAEAEGRDLMRAGTQGVHGYHGDEEDALADRLFAQHLIMERPELQRFDSADAAMHAWHRKQEEEEQSKQPPLAFQPSQARTGCEMADTPPPMCFDRHGQAIGGSWDGATPPMHSPMPRRNIRHHEQEEDEGHGSCGCEHEEADDYVLGLRSYPSANSLDFFMPAPPSLQHFDSADYHMAKAQAQDHAAAGGGEEGPILGDSADNARGAAPPADGYRSVASWFIKRGETRSKRFG